MIPVGTAGEGALRRDREMPARKTNGPPIALDSAFNPIVRYQVAASRSEADEVIAHLPFVVSNGLDAELSVCKEAHRYDLEREARVLLSTRRRPSPHLDPGMKSKPTLKQATCFR